MPYDGSHEPAHQKTHWPFNPVTRAFYLRLCSGCPWRKAADILVDPRDLLRLCRHHLGIADEIFNHLDEQRTDKLSFSGATTDIHLQKRQTPRDIFDRSCVNRH